MSPDIVARIVLSHGLLTRPPLPGPGPTPVAEKLEKIEAQLLANDAPPEPAALPEGQGRAVDRTV